MVFCGRSKLFCGKNLIKRRYKPVSNIRSEENSNFWCFCNQSGSTFSSFSVKQQYYNSNISSSTCNIHCSSYRCNICNCYLYYVVSTAPPRKSSYWKLGFSEFSDSSNFLIRRTFWFVEFFDWPKYMAHRKTSFFDWLLLVCDANEN